jgi:ribosomal protein S6--L-glutamate ligase
MKIAILSYSSPKYKSNKLIIEAGKKRNHDVIVLNPKNLVIYLSDKNGQSRIYSNENGKLERLPKIDALIPRVATNVSHCASIIDFFTNNLGLYSVLSGNSIKTFSSKWSTLLKASESGIKVAKTIYCSDFNSENIDSYIESLKFPIVLKLDKGSQGVGVMLFKDKNSLLSTSETFAKQSNPFILQEKIKTNGKHHDFRAITLKNRCIASMKKTVQSNEFRSNLAKNGKGEYHQISEKERIFIARITDAFEGADTIGLDYMINENDEPVLLEANSNYGTKVLEYNHNLFEDLFCHIEVAVQEFKQLKKRKDENQKQSNLLLEEVQTLQTQLTKKDKLLNEILENEKMKNLFNSLKGKDLGYIDSDNNKNIIRINKPKHILEMTINMLKIEN